MRKGIHRYHVVISAVSALAVAVISLLLLSSYRDVTRTVKGQFAEQQAITTRQTASGIEENIKRLVRELEILSRHPAIQSIEPAAARTAMEETFAHVRHLYVNDISRTDAAGVVRVTITSPELVGRNFSGREYFRRVSQLRERAPVYEFVTFQGAKRGRQGIIIAMPVFRPDGTFAGPVLFLVEVSDLLKSLLPPQTDVRRSWVIDQDGLVLYHPGHPPGTVLAAEPSQDPGFGSFLRSLQQGGELRAEYLTEQGPRVFAAATPVRVAGQTWSVVTETREDAIQRILMRFNIEHLLANLIAVVMIIGSAFAILSLVNRWNRQLREEIAERERTGRELLFREESYRTLVENSPS